MDKNPLSKETDPLDARRFSLKYEPGWNLFKDVGCELTQRDIRLIIKHTNGRSNYLTEKLQKFIGEVDRAEGKKTNWDSRVPRTSTIRVN